MMVLYVGHLLYDDYTLERIYDVLYVYKVHYTLPERITYNRIMHLWLWQEIGFCHYFSVHTFLLIRILGRRTYFDGLKRKIISRMLLYVRLSIINWKDYSPQKAEICIQGCITTLYWFVR